MTTKHKKTTDLIWGFVVGVRSKSLGDLFEKRCNCFTIVSGLDTTVTRQNINKQREEIREGVLGCVSAYGVWRMCR